MSERPSIAHMNAAVGHYMDKQQAEIAGLQEKVERWKGHAARLAREREALLEAGQGLKKALAGMKDEGEALRHWHEVTR